VFDNPLNRLEVYFGLTTASHTEEEEGNVAACGGRCLDLTERLLLRGGEGKGVSRGHRNVPEGIAVDRDEDGFDKPLVDEGKDDRWGLGDAPGLLSRESPTELEEMGEEICLAGRASLQRGNGCFNVTGRPEKPKRSLLTDPDSRGREEGFYRQEPLGAESLQDGGSALPESSSEAADGDGGVCGKEAEEFLLPF
jgi:hypothetical protein